MAVVVMMMTRTRSTDLKFIRVMLELCLNEKASSTATSIYHKSQTHEVL
jgi:hypothetical protein